eukprot:TRINITY_DN1269_c0_g4_i2.p1 TRINITY_DN1269_c0_g4~~TRINITY_DN1269_c0_g4_i2.p1  ORF type:complete len:182 (-),score=28.96 TRINITY_DN1269_c0_g4_i2:368-913(-)
MGSFFSSLIDKIFGSAPKNLRILMLGLDAAGKTTILYALKIGRVETVPTIGFNVETIEYQGVHFNVWDVGGQDKIRALWRHYFVGTQGLIFVVDCSDRERVEEAKEEFYMLLEEKELSESVLLIFANKQDIPGALTPEELQREFALDTLEGRRWHVQGSCARTSEGLPQGLDWLLRQLIPK